MLSFRLSVVRPSAAWDSELNSRSAALLATIALFAASTVSTHAQTSNWTGRFSSNWFLSGNWDVGFSQADERRKHQHCDAKFDGGQRARAH